MSENLQKPLWESNVPQMFRNPSNATSAVGPKPMFIGAQGGNRTRDLRITSALLYP